MLSDWGRALLDEFVIRRVSDHQKREVAVVVLICEVEVAF
jgi:hypothetical protein